MQFLIADKAYDADHWRGFLLARRIQPVIPSRICRRTAIPYDVVRYRKRNTIERMFGRLKDWRRIATRYDKLARNFLAALCLASLFCFWIKL